MLGVVCLGRQLLGMVANRWFVSAELASIPEWTSLAERQLAPVAIANDGAEVAIPRARLGLPARQRYPRGGSFLIVALGLAICHLLAWSSPVRAQTATASLPNAQYYFVFNNYHQGEYKAALRDFTNGASTAYRMGDLRFLDSICYWTMAGECQYHMGNLGGAIEYYEQALKLYASFANQDWQSRLQQIGAIAPRIGAVQSAQITWGQSRRVFEIASLPDSMNYLFGNLNLGNIREQGGVAANPEFKSVNIVEIMRCVAVAAHRRRVIKGTTCKFDPFTNTFLDSISGMNAGDGTLLGAMNGVILGIAYSGMDDWDRARRTLTNSLQFNGTIDHALTPLALLELSLIDYHTERFNTAADLALEASYSAAIFSQFDVLEEALALGTRVHLLTQRSVYPPLEPAIVWSSRNRARLPQASLAIRLAECLAEAGQTDKSATALTEAARGMARSELSTGPLSGRASFVAALNLFRQSKFDLGLNELNQALARYRAGSPWLYQLGLTDTLFVAGTISERQAEQLYQLLLRDPSPQEWRLDPIEAIAFLATPHLNSIARWAEILIKQKNLDRAVEVSELLKRHRFFAELPLGGRLMAFRWMLHAPEQALTPAALSQRTDFMTRFPQYKELADRARALERQTMLLPMKPEVDSEEERQQTATFVELMNVSDALESYLGSFALAREPADMAFPPQLSLSDIRGRMQENQVVLYGSVLGDIHYLFGISTRGTRLLSWQRTRDLSGQWGKLMKATGLAERQLDAATLADETWHEQAWQFCQTLLPEIRAEDLATGTELIVVPDGLYWYLPFELFRIGPTAAESNFLVDSAVFRYAPTLGTAIVPQRPFRQLVRTAVFSGQLDSKLGRELTQEYVTKYQTKSPQIIAYEERLAIPSSLFASVVDLAVIWLGVERPDRGGAFAFHPFQLDRGRPASTLGAWQSLPFVSAEQIVMPTFSSDGAFGPKGNLTGNDLFFTTLGLLASGTRTTLMSRWSTIGASSLELSREYLDQIDAVPPAQALHNAILKIREQTLDPTKEVRVRTSRNLTELKGAHPLFWAGYFVIDVPTSDPLQFPNAEEKEGEMLDPTQEDKTQAQTENKGDGTINPTVPPTMPLVNPPTTPPPGEQSKTEGDAKPSSLLPPKLGEKPTDPKTGNDKGGGKGESKPGDKPGETKPGETKPGETKPGDKSGDKKPGETKPGDKSGESKPGDKSGENNDPV